MDVQSDCCEHYTEVSGCTEVGEFHEQLSDYSL